MYCQCHPDGSPFFPIEGETEVVPPAPAAAPLKKNFTARDLARVAAKGAIMVMNGAMQPRQGDAVAKLIAQAQKSLKEITVADDEAGAAEPVDEDPYAGVERPGEAKEAK